jgi:hypothetical protein
MMSSSKSKRSLPRAKLFSEALRELMGEKRYNQWLRRTSRLLKSNPDGFKIELTRSRKESTK